jgi:DeoR/GlpR family transcriptional regulator of sugar metabolism
MKSDRQRRILELLRENERLDVNELSRLLGVSLPTVRRDLLDLSEQSLIHRRYGSVSLPTLHITEPPVHARAQHNTAAKEAIGRAAADLVSDGDVVYLSGGTTTFQVARHLVTKKRLTIITGAINLISFFASYPDIAVIVPGGLLVHRHLSLVGHIAECALRELRADKAILGVSALSVEHGITAESLLDAETDRAIVSFVPQLVVVTDSTKFGIVRAALVTDISHIHHLVTDSGAPPDQLEGLRAAGVQVRVVQVPASALHHR